MLKNTISAVRRGEGDNHILPFFWQHGEDDETLLRELHAIYDCGIRAVCVESRPNEKFGEPEWFDDMRLILSECKRLGMDFWLLDDKHFPTGYANGLIEKKYPDRARRVLREFHTDVAGPANDCAVMVPCGSSRLLGVIACERIKGDGQEMTGRTIDLTDTVRDGMAWFELPEGYWRLFTIYEQQLKDSYIDPLSPESTDVLIEAVYEPHYRELGEYFGNTFKGFFSDEPYINGNSKLPLNGESSSHAPFPWNRYVESEMKAALGDGWVTCLPALWFGMDNVSPRVRVAYMDTVTKLYSKNFNRRLGDWSRAHGVMYIGHIVEDADYHTQLRSGGHYFRALDGQDMAGIDVVLCQIVPGMSDNVIAVPCSYDIADNEFFHFGLAKLGSSHSHIQPRMKGRAMCEIFGAYGWAEGLKMMKWLTDHMLVRGINEFVPHAFSPKFPDGDCPPHFYAGGHNPEYAQFGLLMSYMNRCAALLQGGTHIAPAALLYHAQAEWSGGKYMRFQTPAKVLTEAQLDFDVIPEDYLMAATASDGRMYINGESHCCLIVPYSEYLPEGVMAKLCSLADDGLQIIFIDGVTRKAVEGTECAEPKNCVSIGLGGLERFIRERGWADVTVKGENTRFMRYYHRSDPDGDIYMVTNEGIGGNLSAIASFAAFRGGEYSEYDPMENTAVKKYSSDGAVALDIPAYNSRMYVFGEAAASLEAAAYSESVQIGELALSGEFDISYADPETPDSFGKAEQRGLYNIVREHPYFAGYVKYEKAFTLSESAGRVVLELGCVGETARVYINGKYVAERIIPPYGFDISAYVNSGENTLTVVTTSHLGYKMRDGLSSFLAFEPVGLLGDVKLKLY